MFAVLLILLKYIFLFLLYLFLALLLWVILKDMKRPTGVIVSTKGSLIQPKVIIIEGDSSDMGKEFELKDETLVGRSLRCDIVLRDVFVSSAHAKIYKRDDGWFVEDLGSKNGTYVRGKRIEEPTQLEVGTKIKLGNTILGFIR